MLALYIATVFLGAALLFTVQPLFTRMALPLLGGAPSVWNTAMVFYQSALLAAYAYAHLTPGWLGVRRQRWLHLALLPLPLLVLPFVIGPGWAPPTGSSPIPWLFTLLAACVGPPFFVLATTGPLLQRWLADSRHRAAADPYFLYAASNLGSLIGLLSYPFLIEPHLGLTAQSVVWAAGYLAFAVLTSLCALIHRPREVPAAAAVAAANPPRARAPRGRRAPQSGPITWRRRLRWLALAFVPSSLMLGVTQHLSTDIAAMPLLWVLPLAIYLLSFVLVFAPTPLLGRRLIRRGFVLAVLVVAVVMSADIRSPIGLMVAIHLGGLLGVALACHGALADDRPPAKSLTEFYLLLATGGALGGVFNALLAPLIFSSIAEYPLVLALACLVVPPPSATPASRRERVLDVALPAAFAGVILALTAVLVATGSWVRTSQFAIVPAALAIALLSFAGRPLRLALGVAALLFVTQVPLHRTQVLLAKRTFFGVHRVLAYAPLGFHVLYNGTTEHGTQNFSPGREAEPLSYYARSGPAGEIFDVLARRDSLRRVAVIGLGAGTLAAYGRPGQQWTFYEIDPEVVRIALDERCFTYLEGSPARLRVVLGDARQSLAADDSLRYDLMIFDAYSSDAIPVHLATREALQLYRERLAPHGVLVFHISSRYFDLIPVMARLAEDAHLACLIRDDPPVTEAEVMQGINSTTYAVMARTEGDLGALARDPRWMRLRPPQQMAAWTDDYSSLFTVIDWRR